MGDSPRSEAFASRFSTPVEELDDHRLQPESLPRASEYHLGRSPQLQGHSRHHSRHHSRRGTAGSTVLPPPTLRITDVDPNITARDFETAIIDDGDNDNASVRDADQHFRELSGSRRDSNSPVVARRATFRLPRQREDGAGDRSRGSSRSSQSTSPPNSVDAFAAPQQRPRAGTANTLQSLSPTIDPQTLRRTSSQRTFERPRAFSEDATRAASDAGTSDHGSVEDDVCYVPPEEPNYPYTIDFEDLEEFVEEQRTKSGSIDHQRSRRASFSCQGAKGKASDNLRKQSQPNCLEKEDSNSLPGVDSDLEDNKSILNEKLNAVSAGKHRRRLNRFNFFSTELEESIHAQDMGDLLMPGETFKGLFELGPEGGCWWMDMMMPTEDEVEVICKAFGIHGLTREDIVQQETREKVELFRSYYFVCFRSFFQADKDADNYLDPVNVYVVVFREGILTFTFTESPHAANVRKRMGRLRDYVALGSDWICYALIDDIVDTFGPVIRSVEEETETIEDSVFISRPEDSRNVLMQISGCRKKNMSLMRLLGGKADVIKGFAKRCNEQYSIAPRQDVGLYLSDIQDHVVTMMSNLGHCEKMLSRSHSNYLAQISADSIAQGTQANKVLSKVTFIGTILVPLNLVCGMFGMNVNVPGKDTDGLGWFFGILGALVFIVLSLLFIAKKTKLL